MNLNFLYILLFICLCFTCKKEAFTTQNWSPESILPLANVKLTLADLIPEEGSVVYDEDNFIRLAYRDDNVFSFSSDSVIDLSTQDGISEHYDFDELEIDDLIEEIGLTLEQLIIDNPLAASIAEEIGIQIPFPNEQQIPGSAFNLLSMIDIGETQMELDEYSEISFITGELSIGIENNLPITIENLELDLSTGAGNVGLFQFDQIETGQTQYLSTDLSGSTIDNNVFVDFSNLTLEEVDNFAEFTITPESGITVFFQINNISVTSITMAFENQELAEYSTTIDFELENGEQIHNLTLATGKIIYEISSTLNTNVVFDLTLPSSTLNGEVFESQQFVYAGTEPTFGEIDIAGLEIDLTTDITQPYNKIPISFIAALNTGDNLVTLTNQDQADLTFSFSDLSIEYADGYFGNYEIDLGGDVVDIDLQLFEDFDSGLILDDPKFIIRVFNSVGVGASIQAGINAFSPYGETAVFEFDEVIEEPNFVGDIVEQIWIYDKNNSTIDDIIALPPQQIEYFGIANLNGVNTGELNFITSESKMSLGVEVDFPMSLNVANISLKDTIEINELENIDKIETLSLVMNIDNGFPLSTKLNLLLRDSILNMTLDTLEIADFPQANVDDEGYLIESSTSQNQLDLNHQEILNFSQSNQLVLDVTLNTEDNQSIRLYSDYEFLVNIGLQLKLSLDE